MVVSSSQDPVSTTVTGATGDGPGRSQGLPEQVIWHDLECGSYRADLPLWLRLAKREGDPILDVGAGSGRVTLELARAGHRVTALDLDPSLLGALRNRAGELPVETICADARAFDLSDRDFALCLVPMQTIQLLAGASERTAFLHCARAHLRRGGLLACALVTELEPFDIADGVPAPTPETARIGARQYTSQALSVRVLPQAVVIERSRRVMPAAAQEPSDGSSLRGTEDRSSAHGSPARFTVERNTIELALLSADELEREGMEAGFRPEPALVIEPTDEHVGSVVVMLRA
jgi:SAM-dependent methyltransferase